MAQNREYFIQCLKLLKTKLSDHDYQVVTGVMRALKYGCDFEYSPGYDLDFEYDIETVKETKRRDNVLKFKVIGRDK
tara:strand:+ start:658 stop:888 length:231 start_codon:yes stop_codon:yes gene_type:complete